MLLVKDVEDAGGFLDGGWLMVVVVVVVARSYVTTRGSAACARIGRRPSSRARKHCCAGLAANWGLAERERERELAKAPWHVVVAAAGWHSSRRLLNCVSIFTPREKKRECGRGRRGGMTNSLLAEGLDILPPCDWLSLVKLGCARQLQCPHSSAKYCCPIYYLFATIGLKVLPNRRLRLPLESTM